MGDCLSWAVFLITKEAHIFSYFSPRYRLCTNIDENLFGLHFSRLCTNIDENLFGLHFSRLCTNIDENLVGLHFSRLCTNIGENLVGPHFRQFFQKTFLVTLSTGLLEIVPGFAGLAE
jgi:hypothetical protein